MIDLHLPRFSLIWLNKKGEGDTEEEETFFNVTFSTFRGKTIDTRHSGSFSTIEPFPPNPLLNVLIDSYSNLNCMICDFGFAHFVGELSAASTNPWTWVWPTLMQPPNYLPLRRAAKNQSTLKWRWRLTSMPMAWQCSRQWHDRRLLGVCQSQRFMKRLGAGCVQSFRNLRRLGNWKRFVNWRGSAGPRIPAKDPISCSFTTILNCWNKLNGEMR